MLICSWPNVVCRLCKLLIVEQLREPVGIFWSVIAPPVLFAFLNTGLNTGLQTVTSVSWYEATAGWYLSYIAVTVSLFSFALYFVGRRESGFVRSFIVGKRAKFVFILAQGLASLALAFCAFVIFIFITASLVKVSVASVAFSLSIPFLIALASSMTAALVIAALPITFQNASSGISIFSAVLLILSVSGNYANPNPILQAANSFNPLHLWASFISSAGTLSLSHILLAVTSLVLGGIGYIYFRVTPVWNRQ